MREHRSAQMWLAVGVLTLAAFALRVWNLGGPTITHPEAYAPGIAFPGFATNPIERGSVTAIVKSSLLTDNHPPGYYILALYWNRAFGVSLASLRFPSALVGVLTIPVLLIAGWRREGRAVALFAATWLAFHGSHVFWSRSARMWVICTAMSVLSIWALSELRYRYRVGWAAVYVASLVVGLWAEYTFWPILAGQMVWEIAARSRSRTFAATIGLQSLAIILASPIFLFLLSRPRSSAYLESAVSGHLEYMLAFDNWFDMDLLAQFGAKGTALSVSLVVVGALLLGLGAWRGSAVPAVDPAEAPAPRVLDWAIWLSALWPAALTWAWRDMPVDPRYPVKTVTIMIPIAVAVTYSLGKRFWLSLQPLAITVFDHRAIRRVVADPNLIHFLVPFGILATASAVMPALAPRSTLALAPFLLILASRGLVWLVRTPIARAVALSIVVFGGCVSSFLNYAAPPARDYAELAAAIDAARRPGDVLVIENDWFAQPLHYYLRPDMMPSRDAHELSNPAAILSDGLERVWVVGFGDDPRVRIAELSSRGLPSFREATYVSSLHAGAALFVKD